MQFPTKDHWRNPSLLAHVEEGLRELASAIQHHGIPSIAVPPLGCGLGGLDWHTVRPLIIDRLAPLPCETVLLQPAPPRTATRTF